MKCPHCEHELTAKEIGALYAGLRKTKGGGRPKEPRCACGRYTAEAARKMGHVCQPIALGIMPPED